MKYSPLALAPALLLALTSCGSTSEAADDSAATGDPVVAEVQSSPTAADAELVSVTATCEQIAPDGGEGLLTETTEWVNTITEDENISADEVEVARDVVAAYDEIIATARPRVREDLEKVAEYPRRFVEAADTGQSEVDLDKEDYQVGAIGLIGTCMYDSDDSSNSEGSASQEESAAPVEEESSLASELKEQFPGYPVLVDATALDYRVAAAFERTGHTGKVVALVPGLYTAYNENITDLDKYYEGGSLYGDTMMHEEYLPDNSGMFWGGVVPSVQEPQS